MAQGKRKGIVTYDREVLLASLMSSFRFQIDGSALSPEEVESRIQQVARRLDEVATEEFLLLDIEVHVVELSPPRGEEQDAPFERHANETRAPSATDEPRTRTRPTRPARSPGLLPPIETGSGLGQILSLDASRRRLDAITVRRELQDWAGPVLGPTAAAQALGLARATLDNWRRDGLIVALPKGQTQHLIPMDQFRDNRPLAGLDRVLQAADGSGMVAWHWLRTPHVDFEGQPPLLALQAGRVDEVRAAAERSLG